MEDQLRAHFLTLSEYGHNHAVMGGERVRKEEREREKIMRPTVMWRSKGIEMMAKEMNALYWQKNALK